MVQFPKALSTFIDWAGVQWSNFEQPPSEPEQMVTKDFIDTGVNYNRIFALPYAAAAIVASTVGVVVNPASGIFKGAYIFFFQGKPKEGFHEAVDGVYNSTRSMYNIMSVFFTAAFGLLPVFNPRMYKGRTLQPTLAQQEAALFASVQNLTARYTQLENACKDGGQAALSAVGPLAANLKKDLIESLQTLRESGALKDPTSSPQYQELQQKALEQIQELKGKLEAATQQLEAVRQKSLGISERQKQQLVKKHELDILGLKGHQWAALEEAKKSESADKVKEMEEAHKQVLENFEKFQKQELQDFQNQLDQNPVTPSQYIDSTINELEQAKQDLLDKNQALNAQILELNKAHDDALKQAEEQFNTKLSKIKTADEKDYKQQIELLKNDHNLNVRQLEEKRQNIQNQLDSFVASSSKNINVDSPDAEQIMKILREKNKELNGQIVELEKAHRESVKKVQDELRSTYDAALKTDEEERSRTQKTGGV